MSLTSASPLAVMLAGGDWGGAGVSPLPDFLAAVSVSGYALAFATNREES